MSAKPRRPRIAARPAATCAWALLIASYGAAQTTSNPFERPIPIEEGAIAVNFVEFASLPRVEGEPARPMHVEREPGGDRLFVNDLHGLVYTLDARGAVTEYLDLRAPAWNFEIATSLVDRGLHGLALHPQFNRPGAPGHGRFYAWVDTANTSPAPDFRPNGGEDHHDTVLLEWRAADPRAAMYDGGPPRELMRFEQPFGNHNAGQLGFNPLSSPGTGDFGMLYVGVADGGSGGDPLDLAQDLSSGFGKIFRIDPLGANSANREYGVPTDNPFAADGSPATLGEIYAYGLRNPNRFAWDPTDGTLFVADIGQNMVEEVSVVTSGANLGWNVWEGSFRYISREEVSLVEPRGEPGFVYPVVEYDHDDPLIPGRAGISGLVVYRSSQIPTLENLLILADIPSGEMFHVPADSRLEGGQADVRRLLLNDRGTPKTPLQVIRETNEQQGQEPAERADLRVVSPDGERIFLLNKHDGVIRRLVE